MSNGLSDKEVVDAVREVGEGLGPGYWARLDEESRFPSEALRALGEKGLIGVLTPRELGGLGLGVYQLSLMLETLARTGAGLGAYVLLSNAIIAKLVADLGGDDLKDELLPPLLRGDGVACLGLSEARTGSDALSIETRASLVEGAYVINGVKDYVNNSDKSVFMLVVARTTPIHKALKKSHGLTIFVVDPRHPGVTHEPYEKKLGMRYFTTNRVVLRDVEARGVLGRVDRGWQDLTRALNIDRIATASMLIGTAEYVLDLAVEYARSRVVFGRPIGSNQAVQELLVNAYVKTVESRLLTLEAARKHDRGGSVVVDSVMALLESSRAALMATDAAMQVFSAKAYLSQVDVERHWRDVRLYSMAPLSKELCIAFIAEHGLGLPKSY